jgi:hypothetical protein
MAVDEMDLMSPIIDFRQEFCSLLILLRSERKEEPEKKQQ